MIGRYRQLVDHAPDGIVVHDGERVLSINAAMLALTGARERSQLIGLPVEALLDHPHLQVTEAQLLTHSVASAPVPVVRTRLLRLDGAVRDVEVRAQLFLEGDAPRAHMVLHDITMRLESERQEARSAAHEQQLKHREVIRVLAGGVAHQLNNALQVVVGAASVLEEELPAQWQHEVRAILEAAARSASMSRQLLQFARQAPNEPRLLTLAAEVRAAMTRLTMPPQTEALRVTISVQDAGMVRLDPLDLRQILQQLLDNARRASAERGTIEVTVGSAMIDARGPGDVDLPLSGGRYASLSVRDSGAGVTPDVRQRLFEPFFTTRPRHEGAGLGLAAVEGIVAQSGGAVLVDSAPGAGTIVTLWLPAIWR